MKRIAIIDGLRTPFCKANGVLSKIQANELGTIVVRELLARYDLNFDEIIMGSVIEHPDTMNIARVIGVQSGLPVSVPGHTVNRNCASGMQAVVDGMRAIHLEDSEIVIAGGVESMSDFPILFTDAMRQFLLRLNKAKSFGSRMKVLASLRPAMFKPYIPKIADPLCGLSMGQTAEVLARDELVSREEQDAFALESHQRAIASREKLAEEIIGVPVNGKMILEDVGPRSEQTVDELSGLRTVFDRLTGTVTAGNSSQITDGAVALILMAEKQAKKLGLKPIGYLTHYSYAGVEPKRMGLGPVAAIRKLLLKTGYTVDDFDLIEINEAFAAQVLAVCRQLGITTLDKLNVNGGAIALGHPLGASGARLILTLAKELKRRGLKRGLASLCVGGGQGEAVIVEVD